MPWAPAPHLLQFAVALGAQARERRRSTAALAHMAILRDVGRIGLWAQELEVLVAAAAQPGPPAALAGALNAKRPSVQIIASSLRDAGLLEAGPAGELRPSERAHELIVRWLLATPSGRLLLEWHHHGDGWQSSAGARLRERQLL